MCKCKRDSGRHTAWDVSVLAVFVSSWLTFAWWCAR